jgi:hypothetical protein
VPDGLTREVLTSAIDGEPFVVYYDDETGILSMFDMDGEQTGERHGLTEEAFRELVEINAQVTSQSGGERMSGDRINRSVAIIDREEELLTEYDEYGNAVEFPIKGLNTGIQSRFSSHDVDSWMHISRLSSPRDGSFIGNVWVRANGHTVAEVRTFAIPTAVRYIDVFITNQIDDDTRTFLDVRPHSTVRHNIRVTNEPYGARVSSFFRECFQRSNEILIDYSYKHHFSKYYIQWEWTYWWVTSINPKCSHPRFC